MHFCPYRVSSKIYLEQQMGKNVAQSLKFQQQIFQKYSEHLRGLTRLVKSGIIKPTLRKGGLFVKTKTISCGTKWRIIYIVKGLQEKD